jgi:hypothetical protein
LDILKGKGYLKESRNGTGKIIVTIQIWISFIFIVSYLKQN